MTASRSAKRLRFRKRKFEVDGSLENMKHGWLLKDSSKWREMEYEETLSLVLKFLTM